MINRYFIALCGVALVTYLLYMKTREIALWRELEALRNASNKKRSIFSHALPVDNDPRLQTPERQVKLNKLREELDRNVIFKIANDLLKRSETNGQ